MGRAASLLSQTSARSKPLPSSISNICQVGPVTAQRPPVGVSASSAASSRVAGGRFVQPCGAARDRRMGVLDSGLNSAVLNSPA